MWLCPQGSCLPYFYLSQLGGGGYPTGFWLLPAGMLLNIPQCTHRPHNEELLTNVNSAEVEKPLDTANGKENSLNFLGFKFKVFKFSGVQTALVETSIMGLQKCPFHLCFPLWHLAQKPGVWRNGKGSRRAHPDQVWACVRIQHQVLTTSYKFLRGFQFGCLSKSTCVPWYSGQQWCSY